MNDLMLLLFLRPALTLTALLTAVALAMRLYIGVTTPAPPTFDLFTYPGCNGPCWQGLEVGKSGAGDLRTVLSRMGVERFTVLSFELTPFKVSVANAPDEQVETMVDLPVEHPRYRYTVTPRFYLRLLDWVQTEAPICVREVFAAYGLPEQVYQSDSYLYLVYWHGDTAIWFTITKQASATTTVQGLFSAQAYQYALSVAQDMSYPYPLEAVGWSDVEGYFRQPCEVG